MLVAMQRPQLAQFLSASRGRPDSGATRRAHTTRPGAAPSTGPPFYPEEQAGESPQDVVGGGALSGRL